jgi:hypothetical protein
MSRSRSASSCSWLSLSRLDSVFVLPALRAQWEERTGSSVTVMRFESGAIGTIRLAVGEWSSASEGLPCWAVRRLDPHRRDPGGHPLTGRPWPGRTGTTQLRADQIGPRLSEQHRLGEGAKGDVDTALQARHGARNRRPSKAANTSSSLASAGASGLSRTWTTNWCGRPPFTSARPHRFRHVDDRPSWPRTRHSHGRALPPTGAVARTARATAETA